MSAGRWAVTTWDDKSREPLYGYTEQGESTAATYIEGLLGSLTTGTCPAIPDDEPEATPLRQEAIPVISPDPPKKPNHQERKRLAAFDKVVPLLIVWPHTVEELAEELGISCRLVADAVEKLRVKLGKYGSVIMAQSGLMFLHVKKGTEL